MPPLEAFYGADLSRAKYHPEQNISQLWPKASLPVLNHQNNF